MNSKLIITPEQLNGPPKIIGKNKFGDVFYLKTKGGLALIMQRAATGTRVLGIGNHVAIAKGIAQDDDPTLVFNELSKSEQLPRQTFQHLIPSWRQIMNEVNCKINE